MFGVVDIRIFRLFRAFVYLSHLQTPLQQVRMHLLWISELIQVSAIQKPKFKIFMYVTKWKFQVIEAKVNQCRTYKSNGCGFSGNSFWSIFTGGLY